MRYSTAMRATRRRSSKSWQGCCAYRFYGSNCNWPGRAHSREMLLRNHRWALASSPLINVLERANPKSPPASLPLLAERASLGLDSTLAAALSKRWPCQISCVRSSPSLLKCRSSPPSRPRAKAGFTRSSTMVFARSQGRLAVRPDRPPYFSNGERPETLCGPVRDGRAFLLSVPHHCVFDEPGCEAGCVGRGCRKILVVRCCPYDARGNRNNR